jgi:hypothetical protein
MDLRRLRKPRLHPQPKKAKSPKQQKNPKKLKNPKEDLKNGPDREDDG